MGLFHITTVDVSLDGWMSHVLPSVGELPFTRLTPSDWKGDHTALLGGVCVWGCTIGLYATLEVRNLCTLPSCSGCGSFFLGAFHVAEDWFRADRKRAYPFSAIG